MNEAEVLYAFARLVSNSAVWGLTGIVFSAILCLRYKTSVPSFQERAGVKRL